MMKKLTRALFSVLVQEIKDQRELERKEQKIRVIINDRKKDCHWSPTWNSSPKCY